MAMINQMNRYNRYNDNGVVELLWAIVRHTDTQNKNKH